MTQEDSMEKLVIDQELCVDCGNCEAWLPGLSKQQGAVLISESNPNVDKGAIERAIASCPLDALSLVPHV